MQSSELDVAMEPQSTMNNEESDMEWIRITSEEGFSFMIRRKVANTSGTLKNMILGGSGAFSEGNTKVCHIQERPIIVEKMCEYMTFKAHYEKAGPKEEIPVQEFMDRIPPEIALELLLAADYYEL
jgi:transcription elongation factor B subunit 1